MARMTRTARPEDRSEVRTLQQQVEELQRENRALRDQLAKGPSDETWFTPGLLSVLALGLFFALWARYAPTLARLRSRPAAVAVTSANDYNPPPPAAR